MQMRNLSKAVGNIGLPRHLGKRLRRLSKSPATRTAAVLIPILTLGAIATRKFMR